MSKIPIYFIYILVFLCIFTVKTQQNRNLEADKNLSEIKQQLCDLYQEKSSDGLIGSEQIENQSGNLDSLGFLKDSTADKTYLKEYLYDDKDSAKLAKNVIIDIIPLFIFFIFSIFGFFGYILFYFCQMCCPRCICCKKKNTDFYSHYEINCPLVALTSFGTWVIITSVLGLVKGTNLLNGYYQVECQLATFFYDVDNGLSDQNYYGLQRISEESGLITQNLQDEITNTFDDNTQMEQDFQSMDDISADLNILQGTSYSTYYYSATGDSDFDVQSFFFNDVWASAQQSDNRHSHNIRNIVENSLTDLNEQVISANNAGLKLKDSNLFQSITEGQVQIKELQVQINDVSNQVYDFNNDNEQALQHFDTVVLAYFGVSLGFSILSMLTAFLIRKCKMYKLRCCLHLTWVIYGIAMILGFLISLVLYSVSNLGLQTCSLIDDIKLDKSLFDDLQDTGINTDFIDTLGVCIEYGTWAGNGEILNEFGLQENLSDMKEMSSSMSESITIYDNSQSEFTDLSNYLTLAASDLDTFINYGYYTSTPNIYELNISSQDGISGAADGIITNDCGGSPTYDTFKDGDCATYDNIATDIQEVFDDVDLSTNTYCGNIHLYYNQGIPFTYNMDEYSTCDSSTNLGKRLIWVKEKNILAYQKKTELANFSTSYTSYKSELDAWILEIENLQNQFDSTFKKIEALVDQGANCLFLGEALFNIFDTICQVQIYDAYVIAIILICHSMGMFFGSLFLYIGTFRISSTYDRENRYQKANQKTVPKQIRTDNNNSFQPLKSSNPKQ